MTTQRKQSADVAKAIILADLDQIRADALARLDQFTIFVHELGKGSDSRLLSTPHAARRILEEVELVSHVHQGGSDGRHVRELTHKVLDHLAGEVIW